MADVYTKLVWDEETGKKECPNGVSWSGQKRHGDNTKGVRTGNGIVVLDIDTKDFTQLSKDMQKLLKKLTPTIETARGYHYYFRYADSKRFTNKAGYSKFVDVRSDGGIIFNQYNGDSEHISYTKVGDIIAKMPEKLETQLFADMTTSNKASAKREQWSEIEKGAVHDGIIRYMAKDKSRGLSYEEILQSANAYVVSFLGGKTREYTLMIDRLDWVVENVIPEEEEELEGTDLTADGDFLEVREACDDSRAEFFELLDKTAFERGGYGVSTVLTNILASEMLVEKKIQIKDYAKANGVAVSDVEGDLVLISQKIEAFEKLYERWLIDGEAALEFAKISNTQDYRFKNLRKYEENHHLVNHGGKPLLVSRSKDDFGNMSIGMNPIATDKVIWADRQCIGKRDSGIEKVDTVDAFVYGYEDDDGYINACDRYYGMEFAPNKKLAVAYNLFTGFKQKAVEGKIGKFKKTMTAIYGEKEYSLMMDWFADMYQNPNRKCTFALIIRGAKGTGKNTFEKALGQNLLSNENYFRTANTKHLFGSFNRALASNLLIVGQEVVWGGSHAHDSTLKDMVTENTRVVEMKGVDSFTLSNFSRLYFTSNADWVIPASIDERRYYVVEPHAGVLTKNGWTKFYKWLEKSSTKEALMYEMLHRDLSNFDNINCPDSVGLGSQKRESFYGVDAFVAEAIENGHFGRESKSMAVVWYDPNNSEKIVVATEFPLQLLFNSFSQHNKNGKITLNTFSRSLTKLGLVKSRKTQGIFYEMGDREALAKNFLEKTGVKLTLLNL